MSADVTYKVVVDLETKGTLGGSAASGGAFGALDAKLGSVDSRITSLGGTIAGMGQSLAGAFTGAVESVAGVVAGMGKLAAIGVGAGIAYGVTHLNNELEKTQISLAAIFNANGLSADMADGMGRASAMMGKIRADAAALPGETKDLMQFFTLGLNPGLKLGGSADQLEKLSANAMAAAAATNVPMDQAAREYAMLLQGRAGAHNIFGAQLGFSGESAEKFNKLSGSDRLKAVTDALVKFEPAIQTFSTSFEGASSTFRDNAKKFVADATNPLFRRVTETLLQGNTWLENNQALIAGWADKIGGALVAAYDKAGAAIDRWWPALETFARNAEQRLAEIWHKVEPLVEKVGGKALGFLSDPTSLGKIEGILKLYAAVKLGGGAGGVGGVLGSLASAGGGLGSAIGGAFGGPMGAMLGDKIGEIGTLIDSFVLLAPLAIAAAGAVHVLTDETSSFHQSAVAHWESLKSKMSDTFAQLGDIWQKVEPAAIQLADALGNGLLAALDMAASSVQTMAHAMSFLAERADVFLKAVGFDGPAPSMNGDARFGKTGDASRPLKAAVVEGIVEADVRGRRLGGGGGGGGTHIQKVEITVASNQDPSRIAKLVHSELANLAKHPRVSKNAINWSASRT